MRIRRDKIVVQKIKVKHGGPAISDAATCDEQDSEALPYAPTNKRRKGIPRGSMGSVTCSACVCVQRFGAGRGPWELSDCSGFAPWQRGLDHPAGVLGSWADALSPPFAD